MKFQAAGDRAFCGFLEVWSLMRLDISGFCKPGTWLLLISVGAQRPGGQVRGGTRPYPAEESVGVRQGGGADNQ